MRLKNNFLLLTHTKNNSLLETFRLEHISDTTLQSMRLNQDPSSNEMLVEEWESGDVGHELVDRQESELRDEVQELDNGGGGDHGGDDGNVEYEWDEVQGMESSGGDVKSELMNREEVQELESYGGVEG